MPHFLPDGNHFLYYSENELRDENGVYACSLDGRVRKKLLSGDTAAIYAGMGYLLFNRADTVYAQPFDLKRIELTGDPVPLAERVLRFGNAAGANVFASLNGVLAYRTGAAGADLEMV